ncbi:MAG: SemiSWEET family sugar transporter [Solirubrobacterales bacterium]
MGHINAEAVGMVAAVLSTVSLLPQVRRTWVTRSAQDLSFSWMIMALVAMALWIIYGLMLDGWSVVFANSLAGTMIVALIAMKLSFDRRRD